MSTRDWAAEWAAIEADFREACSAIASVYDRAGPGIRARVSKASAEDIRAYGEAKQRLNQVKARRADFLAERKKQGLGRTKPP